MSTDRSSTQGVRDWLSSVHGDPWTFPTSVGQCLTSASLIRADWNNYNPDLKLGLLLSILCIKKLHLSTLEADLTEIIKAGKNDTDTWVQLIAKMVETFPRTGMLRIQIEDILPDDARNGLQRLIETIRNYGIKFHPAEYAFIDHDVCDDFSLLPDSGASATMSYFKLRPTHQISRSDRLSLLKNSVNTSSSLNAGFANSSGSNPVPSPNRPAVVQNVSAINTNNHMTLPSRQNTIHTANPLFIPPKRRLSQHSQQLQPAFLRPSNSSRPTQINATRGVVLQQGSLVSTNVEVPVDITTGKTYRKPTRIQMLDIDTGTSIIKNQEESLLKTQQEEQQLKEQRKLEKEKRQEEKRREEEEKRVQKEKEKVEKQRQREEIKSAKDKEKREKAAAKAASAAAQAATAVVTNGLPNTIVPVTPRKKKRLSNDQFQPVQEELISDDERLHKDTTLNIVSPTSPVSPTNMYSSPVVQAPPSLIELTSVNPIPPTNEIAETPSNASIPMSTSEPTNPVSSDSARDEHVQSLANSIFTLTNQLSDEDRQTIWKFLEGTYGRESGNTVPGANDVIRQIVMHVERTHIYEEGKEIVESVIFEMNLTQGTWRKLKRKKVKRNAIHDINGKPNGYTDDVV